MDIYVQKSRWKWYLAGAGILIVTISAIFTINLTNKLSKREAAAVELWFKAHERLAKGVDLTMATEVLSSIDNIPMILYNYEEETIDDAISFGKRRDMNSRYIERQLKKLQKTDNYFEVPDFPIRVYYKKSRILQLIQLFPLVQILLISGFIVFGYFSFSTAKRAEQNRVWAGMAKETAHQLGTPITAIVGWIDYLRSTKSDDGDIQEVTDELSKDVKRLELIADRFSKIGSSPELKPVNLFEELENARIYMQRRAPRKVVFDFPSSDAAPKIVHINAHLFAWVIENLLRNALDAMGRKGTIAAKVYEHQNHLFIDISDTGKGIPSSNWRKVFQPGYSTKKRGWGLGLSLAKRIIEDYHSGRIFVKESKENVGTTFTIRLPKP